MMRSGVKLCSWKSPAPSAGNTGFYFIRSVSAKQSGWLGNPVDYRIWLLMQECVYIVHVQGTWLRHQRLDAAHQWHMSVTKRRSCWSLCMRQRKRTSLSTSAKLKPALFRANTLHDRLFPEPPTVYTKENTVTFSLWLVAVKLQRFINFHTLK